MSQLVLCICVLDTVYLQYKKAGVDGLMGAMTLAEQSTGPIRYSEKLSPSVNISLMEASCHDGRVCFNTPEQLTKSVSELVWGSLCCLRLWDNFLGPTGVIPCMLGSNETYWEGGCTVVRTACNSRGNKFILEEGEPTVCITYKWILNEGHCSSGPGSSSREKQYSTSHHPPPFAPPQTGASWLFHTHLIVMFNIHVFNGIFTSTVCKHAKQLEKSHDTIKWQPWIAFS